MKRHGLLSWRCGQFLLPVLAAVSPAFGQPSPSETNALPRLAPPYGEIQPTFWELHGTLIIVAGVVFVLLLGLVIWLALRPRRHEPLAPEVVARLALAKLGSRAEDGVCLSAVSQVVRRYFISAFHLATGELNTTEFCAAIAADPKIGADLATPLAGFLRQCDERKFSAAPAATPLNAVNQAQEFLARAEARRAATQPPPA
jgi:hypothetical protein